MTDFDGITLFQARILLHAGLENGWATIYHLNDCIKPSVSSQAGLTQLVNAGFLLRRQGRSKGSSVYRITPAGRELVALLERLNRARVSILSPPEDRLKLDTGEVMAGGKQ